MIQGMRVLLRLLTVVALTMGVATIIQVPVACACSCATRTTAEALDAATAVFDGEVIATSQPTSGFSGELITYSIRVTRVYKGGVPAVVTVRSEASEGSCGVRLSGTPTVFAYGLWGDLRTGLCSAPIRLDRAELGVGFTPTPAPAPSGTGEPPASPPPPSWVGPVIWSLVGVGIAAAVLVLRLRRR